MIRLFFVFIIGFFIQFLLYGALPFENLKIDLLLIITISSAVTQGSLVGEVTGFFSGIIEDITTMGIFGGKSLIRIIIGYFSGKLKGRIMESSVFFQIALVFVMFIISGFAGILIQIIYSYPSISIKQVFINAIVNALISPAVFWAIGGRRIVR